jgi:hypothetical protein
VQPQRVIEVDAWMFAPIGAGAERLRIEARNDLLNTCDFVAR